MRLWAFISVLLAVAGGLPSLQGASTPPSDGKIDFTRDIRPILADNCLTCHGPDEKARKAKLRLDLKSEALLPLKSGPRLVVPGDPAKSALMARVVAKDEDDLMPPVKSGKTLTARQITTLRQWISEGAKWPTHWAYTKAERPPVPAVKNRKWAQNEVDLFVLERLEKEHLTPAPEADKTTLARRVSLDLTGLPPSVEELDAFLADKSAGAYERLVDRLLESPHYGEQMARYWMDAARYADSHGYHIDSQRDIWAYRDWLISSFNANKPFDQFTIEQLAGDLLPNATREQKVGSGYIRCNMSTGEGGAIDAEYQAKYAFDRLETTSTIWLGLTMVCARCHTHKYDPIAQREYYGLLSFFNNIDEPIIDGNKPNPDPFMKLPTPQQNERLDSLRKRIEEAQRKVDAPAADLDTAQTAWMKEWAERFKEVWTTVAPNAAKSTSTNGSTLKRLPDNSVLAEGKTPDQETYEVSATLAAGNLTGLRLEAMPDASLPKGGSGRGEDGRFQLSEFEAEIVPPADEKAAKPDPAPAPRKLSFAQALADASEGDSGADKAIDDKSDTAWTLPPAAITNTHSALFLLRDPVPVAAGSELLLRLKFAADKGHPSLGRFRVSAAKASDLAQSLQPPRFEPWQVLGPFKQDGLKEGFAKAYEPESEIDLKKGYPGVRDEIHWNARGDLEDGKSHLLVHDLHGVHGVYYFHRTVEVKRPMHVDLSLAADDLYKVWVNGQLLFERTELAEPGEEASSAVVVLAPGVNRILVKVANQVGSSHFAFNHVWREPDLLPGDVAALLALGPEVPGDWQTRLRYHYRRQFSAEFAQVFSRLEIWRQAEKDLDQAIPTTLIAKELGKPRETFVLMRGEYDKPGEKVTAGVPVVLPPLPAGAPTNRLGLARWLVDPGHPLTSRVVVNRLWQQYFGVGLVKTAEDFGVQGEKPSHPALLDWLATELIRSGWNTKHIQRLIATSATYRQTANLPASQRAADPENRLLARGPRFRMDAESLRDTALFVGGLLVDKQGGHSVKPFEPPGLWEAVSFNNSQKYLPDKGEAQYRRSVYTNWKRQSPPPNMLLFDAPTREYCVVRRPRTNTPLQALALLNDPQYVEAARGLAQRMIREGGAEAGRRLAYGFRLATARNPTRAEMQVLLAVLARQTAEYRHDSEAARQLLTVGESKVLPTCAPWELAAWTTLASMILNLDETVTKG